jgi:hypothetical protein
MQPRSSSQFDGFLPSPVNASTNQTATIAGAEASARLSVGGGDNFPAFSWGPAGLGDYASP